MSRGINAAAALAGLVAIVLIFGSWYTVDQTEGAVLLRNGAVAGTAMVPGSSVPFVSVK